MADSAVMIGAPADTRANRVAVARSAAAIHLLRGLTMATDDVKAFCASPDEAAEAMVEAFSDALAAATKTIAAFGTAGDGRGAMTTTAPRVRIVEEVLAEAFGHIAAEHAEPTHARP